MFAIALKILIPPGLMTRSPTNDLPFALVLCTGQGAMVVPAGDALPGHSDQDKAPTSSSQDGPCLFAGHALSAPPPVLFDAGKTELIAYAYRAQPPVSHVLPGRGLTGPPLPARGPPSLLI